MAKKTKIQQELDFRAHVEELAAAYGLKPAAIVPSQILDLAEDLSGESHANVYALVAPTVVELFSLWSTLGSKPNVIVDSKIKNALTSFGSVSPEFAILFVQHCELHGIKLKNANLLGDLKQVVEESM